jgi:hypothetical protein
MLKPMSRQSWISDPRSKFLNCPLWAKELMSEVVDNEAPGQITPRLGFFPTPNGDYGGRWFPSENAIGVYLVGDKELEKVVLLHELSHFLGSFKGNFPGRHDKDFYLTAARLYTKYGAKASIVEHVERRIRWSP